MNLFSKLFRRDHSASNSVRARSEPSMGIRRQAGKRLTKSADNQDDEVLLEDPERQRARHRLIGAAALVLVAVVGLPRILDSQPKKVSNDIAVQIVTSLPNPIAGANPTPVNSAPANSPSPSSSTASTSSATLAASSASKSSAEVVTESNTSAPKPNAANKKLALAPGEEVVQSPATSPSVPSTSSAPSAGLPTSSSKYVVQVGSFSSEEGAIAISEKLKDLKINNRITTRTNPDGSKLFVVRTNPYNDREAAESAEKKIKSLGVTPRLIELAK